MSFYRPLPDFLYIDKSSIEGHGLFTNRDLLAGTELGITHIKDERFQEGYSRTPLGGFYNHSDKPNCETYIQDDFLILRTIKLILSQEELTAFYTLYKLGNKK
jgi:SET domain-containing protein